MGPSPNSRPAIRTRSEARNLTASPGTGVGDGLSALDGVADGPPFGSSPAPVHETRTRHTNANTMGDRARPTLAACTRQL
jgi:hypothetical protein